MKRASGVEFEVGGRWFTVGGQALSITDISSSYLSWSVDGALHLNLNCDGLVCDVIISFLLRF